MTYEGLICDQMLRKLARWLRMAGYDVLAPDGIDDEVIFELARTTGRALLTRDKDLSNRKGIVSLRILSDDLDGQLREVVDRFKVPAEAVSRCPLCNGSMFLTNRACLSNAVPAKVLERQDRFFRCGSCGKTYWEGTHWERIVRDLATFGINPSLPGGPEDKSNQAA